MQNSHAIYEEDFNITHGIIENQYIGNRLANKNMTQL